MKPTCWHQKRVVGKEYVLAWKNSHPSNVKYEERQWKNRSGDFRLQKFTLCIKHQQWVPLSTVSTGEAFSFLLLSRTFQLSYNKTFVILKEHFISSFSIKDLKEDWKGSRSFAIKRPLIPRGYGFLGAETIQICKGSKSQQLRTVTAEHWYQKWTRNWKNEDDYQR